MSKPTDVKTPLNMPHDVRRNTAYFDSLYSDYNKPDKDDSYQKYTATPTSLKSLSSVMKNQIEEIDMKDIADVTLTTLGFLSFGIFILHILIVVTMGKYDFKSLMMPMESTNYGNVISNDNIEEIRRKKRSTNNFIQRLVMINNLSLRVLNSIDSLVLLPNDNGVCHYLTLCDNNKYSRKQLKLQCIEILLSFRAELLVTVKGGTST